ncbi:MAG: bifunctional diaminohydroxyphosphoribosylaminopyrimidine deaminase/5-amino-6-(5-phosphoribosylamino)uracil reductase, partial [Mycobacterium sp.]
LTAPSGMTTPERIAAAMALAVEQARRVKGSTYPNPPVGAVILAPDGTTAQRQPLRVVVGEREIPPESLVLNDDSPTMLLRTRDPHEVIRALSDRTDVLLEGGPTLAGAFLRAGAVHRILAYVAPILLGGPVTAVDDVGVATIADALRWRYDGVERIGPDVLLSLVPGETPPF